MWWAAGGFPWFGVPGYKVVDYTRFGGVARAVPNSLAPDRATRGGWQGSFSHVLRVLSTLVTFFSMAEAPA